MRWRDAIHFAITSFGSSKIRSMLTVLGFAVGVGAVLTVLTLGDAGEIRVEEEISKLGVNKVWIRQKNSKDHFRDDDAERLHDATGSPVCAGAFTAAVVSLDGRTDAIQVAGFDEGLDEVHKLQLIQGRQFTRREFQQGSLVCLVDDKMAEAFGGLNPGECIYIDERRFTIVGITKAMHAQFGGTSGGMAIMPLTAYIDTFGGEISEIILLVPTGRNVKVIAEQAAETLVASGDFRIDTLEAEIGAAREIVRIFVMVLMAVAGVCILSGGIGVMNVLLLSVRERKREIGMLKAIGATALQICVLFLIEAGVYATLGGCSGYILGLGMIKGCGLLIGIDGSVRFVHAAALLMAVVFLGVGFGVLPALQAAKLQPVDALSTD